MVQFSSFLNGLTKNITTKNGKKRRINLGREATIVLAKEARKNGLLLTSPGNVSAKWSSNYVSAYSRGGNKGINQDCFIVWEAFGGKEDVMFCGVFDGHGPWGHLVSKRVKKVMPAFLLHYWQEASAQCSAGLKNANLNQFGMWKKSFKRACSTVDTDLELHPVIDSFYSGTAALTIIREGELIVLANVGDSRAVLGTSSDDGSLVAVQLTVDFKPNLPEESERIHKSGGSVCEADDEPGVSRIRAPHEESPDGPGLALSRAFGDFFVKDFGLISEPDVIQRTVTTRDRFVILATDGVWDVVSNEKAVEIVSSATERDEAAKRIVDYAAGQWKLKRPGYAVDDISVVCLFFHNPVADPEILSSGHT
ncbi:probable protein phosphatase 2C 34 [Cynara cardunculus var. scolymus]|uniref:probable protein phosphatase 2C 34 n=1 Tax=Cynara cardunculus var. scolymus TaxID=59895 RepID=UPI000D623087|nr:probable protein phosphatase 2C 34 [Cynara cardunculus var. scolymus]